MIKRFHRISSALFFFSAILIFPFSSTAIEWSEKDKAKVLDHYQRVIKNIVAKKSISDEDKWKTITGSIDIIAHCSAYKEQIIKTFPTSYYLSRNKADVYRIAQHYGAVLQAVSILGVAGEAEINSIKADVASNKPSTLKYIEGILERDMNSDGDQLSAELTKLGRRCENMLRTLRLIDGVKP